MAATTTGTGTKWRKPFRRNDFFYWMSKILRNSIVSLIIAHPHWLPTACSPWFFSLFCSCTKFSSSRTAIILLFHLEAGEVVRSLENKARGSIGVLLYYNCSHSLARQSRESFLSQFLQKSIIANTQSSSLDSRVWAFFSFHHISSIEFLMFGPTACSSAK
jgi:hypothetical protein